MILIICPQVECANGQTGFGKRRRRNVDEKKAANKVYEVSMSTVVRVGDDNDANADASDKADVKTGRREKETFIVEEGKKAPDDKKLVLTPGKKFENMPGTKTKKSELF